MAWCFIKHRENFTYMHSNTHEYTYVHEKTHTCTYAHNLSLIYTRTYTGACVQYRVLYRIIATLKISPMKKIIFYIVNFNMKHI